MAPAKRSNTDLGQIVKKFKLLTVSNTKTLRGNAAGYLTAVLHLAPADLSGTNICALADLAGCKVPCLNTTGHGGIAEGGMVTYQTIAANTRTNTVQAARLRRTRLFLDHQAAFMALLVRDITKFVGYAAELGLKPCVRLNGTSDIRWEDIPATRDGASEPNIFWAFPLVQFYDYTKLPNRRRALAIPNYHLTFSYSHRASFAPIVVKALQTYGNAVNFAVVFKSDVPAHFLGRTVIDGDATDLRFLEASGHVVALTAKGTTAKQDRSGFMVP